MSHSKSRRWAMFVLGVAVVIGHRITVPAAADPGQPTKTQAVQVLAYGFPGIDERDLGVMFSADLSRLQGAPRLYDQGKPKRVARNSLEKQIFRASESNTVDAGVQFLFLGLGVQQTESHDALVLHSRMVKDVIMLDDGATLSEQEIPADAVFYLAEVHTGTTVDLTAEADYAGASQQLSLLFDQGSVSAKDAQAKTKATIRVRALGLTDFMGDGAFAMTLDQIRASFRSDPAPVELVFRTIPGKTYEPPRMIERVINESNVEVGEGDAHPWIVQPGKYKVFGTSGPNGLTAAWSGVVTCDRTMQKETRRFEATCLVRTPATLTIANPTGWGLGPAESVNLFVARLPEQIDVADADMQALVRWWDKLVAVVVSNSRNCSKMSVELNALLDTSADVIEMARKHTTETPEWLTAYLADGSKRLADATQKCAGDSNVRQAFERLTTVMSEASSSTPAMAGSIEADGGVDAAIATMGRFADKLCACRDMKCAEGVMKDMSELKEPSGTPTKAQMEKAMKIAERMAECQKKLMQVDMPPAP